MLQKQFYYDIIRSMEIELNNTTKELTKEERRAIYDMNVYGVDRNDKARYWKPKWSSPEELAEKIGAYFKKCDEEEEPYLITGLALALDTNRMTLLNWQRMEQDRGTEFASLPKEDIIEMSNLIKYAKAKCEHYGAKGLIKGTINPAAAIFNLKSNYKWIDKSELDITSGNNPLDNTRSINIVMPESMLGIESEETIEE